MAELLKDVELSKKGSEKGTVKGGDALKGKPLVGLYFSAHWCGPCRQFTPHLRAFYDERRANGEQFEIVFVSLDKTPEALAGYLAEAHGDWYYLPHGSEWIKKLNDKYAVKGVPKLVVVNPDGEVLSEHAVEEVTAPKVAYADWKEYAAWMEQQKKVTGDENETESSEDGDGGEKKA